MIELPKKISKLAKIITANGGRAMLVGGCVRDELMGGLPKDWDLDIYGIEPHKLREILEKYHKQGQINFVQNAELLWTAYPQW